MGNKTKLAKLREDKFYKLAKETGYRSRAAFKLIQLDRKFSFLKDARVLVDLCAAPGGWLQVAANLLPVSSVIVGVDLVPIKPIRNVITIVGDITADSCLKQVKTELQDWKANIVLHDGAPNLGQNWISDAFGQAQLTLSAIKMMTNILEPDGWFVTKIFRSKDYGNIIKLLSQLFKHIHSTKPVASRKESAEIFVVCQHYVGLKNFDHKLLNFKSVFQEEEETNETKLTIKKFVNNKKPNRRGFTDDVITTVYEEKTLTDFLRCESPLKFLIDTNKIILDKNFYEPDSVTPKEIRECIKDVRVIGIREIKQLFSWRNKLRKIFRINLEEQEEEEEVEVDTEKTDTEILQNEIDEAMKRESKEDKMIIKKKRKLERTMKLKGKRALKQREDFFDDTTQDVLFSLASLNNEKMAKIVKEDHCSIHDDIVLSDDDEENILNEDDKSYLKTHSNKLVKLQKKSASNQMSKILSLNSNHDSQDDEINDEINDEVEADIRSLLKVDKKIKEPVSNSYKTDIISDISSSKTDKPVKKTILLPEELALAAHLRKSEQDKKEAIENSWNRNTRPLDENLPTWFKEYEDTHRIRILPITKEEVDFYREKQREVDARPLKKVVEAKARKHNKKIALLEKTRCRAEKLLEGDGFADDDKVDVVKNLYKKANKLLKTRVKKKIVVAKKYLSTGKHYRKPGGVKGRVKVVDPRMKKDQRNTILKNKRKSTKRRSKSRTKNRK